MTTNEHQPATPEPVCPNCGQPDANCDCTMGAVTEIPFGTSRAANDKSRTRTHPTSLDLDDALHAADDEAPNHAAELTDDAAAELTDETAGLSDNDVAEPAHPAQATHDVAELEGDILEL